MAEHVVNIKFNFDYNKQKLDEIGKKITQSLSIFSRPIETKALSLAVTTEMEKVDATVTKLTNDTKEKMEVLIEKVEEIQVAAKNFNQLLNSIFGTFATNFGRVEKRIDAVESKVHGFFTRLSIYPIGFYVGVTTFVDYIESNLKIGDYILQKVNLIGKAVYAGAERSISVLNNLIFNPVRRFFWSFFTVEGLESMGANSVIEMMGNAFGRVVSTLGQGVLFWSLMKMASNEAIATIRRLLGLGGSAISPLERAKSLIVAIESSLFSVIRPVGHLLKLTTFLGLTVTGIISPIIGGLAMLSSLLNVITSMVVVGWARFLARFGGIRSEIYLIIIAVRKFFTQLRPFLLEMTKQKGGFFGIGGQSPLQKFLVEAPNQFRALSDNAKKVLPAILQISASTESFRKALTGAVAEQFFLRLTVAAKQFSEIVQELNSRLMLVEPKKMIEATTATGEAAAKGEQITKASLLRQVKDLQDILRTVATSGGILDTSKARASIARLFQSIFILDKSEYMKIKLALSGNVQNIKDDLAKLFGPEIAEAVTKAGEKGDAGRKFIAVLNRQIKAATEEGRGEIRQRLDDFVSSISKVALTPDTLQTLEKSGSKIPEYIGKGMSLSVDKVRAGASRLAEAIMKFFPRSPVAMGPLMLLPFVGPKIVKMIVSGLIAGIGQMKNAAGKLAGAFVETFSKMIEKFLDVRKMSIFTGMSMAQTENMSNFLAQFGASLADISYLSRSINDTFENPEKRKELEKMGISIEKAAKSGDYLREIMFQIADVINKQNLSFADQQKLLQNIGIVGQSNLLLIFAESREELEKMYRIASNPLFKKADISEFAKLKNQFMAFVEEAKTSILSRVLEPLTKELESLKAKAFDFIDENGLKIAAGAAVAGELAANVLQVVIAIGKYLMTDLPGAWRSFINTVGATLDFMGKWATNKIETHGLAAGKLILITVHEITKVIYALTTDIFAFAWRHVEEIPGRLHAKVAEAGKKAFDEVVFWVERILAIRALRTTLRPLAEKLVGAPIEFVGDPASKAEAEKRFAEQQEQMQKEKMAYINPLKETENAVLEAGANITAAMSNIFNAPRTQENLEEAKQNLQEFKDEIKAIVGDLPAEVKGPVIEFMNMFDMDAMAEKYKLAMEKVKQETEIMGTTVETVAEKLKDFKDFFNELSGQFGSAFSGMATAMGDMYEMSGKKAKEFIVAQKAFNIASATMSIATGITKALEFGLWGIPLAAMIAAAGAVQIAKIISTPVGMAAGGLVRGGSGNKDDVPIMGMGGEFMLRKEAVEKYGLNFLESMNQLQAPMMKDGGLVPSPVAVPVQSEASGHSEVNIINFQDPRELENFMASKRGESIVLNHFQRNKSKMRSILAM